MHTTAAAMPSPHVICAKFRADVSAPSAPEPQPLSSPMAEQWNDPWSGATIPRETDGFHWGRRESKEDIKQQRRGTADGLQQSKVNTIPKEDLIEGRTTDAKGENLRYGINIGDGTQGTWLVLDTLDELGTWPRPSALAGSCLKVSSCQRTRTFYVSFTDVLQTRSALHWFQSTSFQNPPSLLHPPIPPLFPLKRVPYADPPAHTRSGVWRFPNERSNLALET